jgi:hypothetical protein
MKQKGIISYGIAPNRQYPLAGAFHDAFFNTWRRFSTQVLYWAPPMIAGYYVLNWAIERYGDVCRRHTQPHLTSATGTTTSTRRPAGPSLAARRSKQQITRNDGQDGSCVRNRRTCTSQTWELRIDVVAAHRVPAGKLIRVFPL